MVLLQIIFLQYNLYSIPCYETSTEIFRYDTDYSDRYNADPQQHHRRRLPQCLIIGVRKGGTRALLDAIALHPMIKVARREVHFFNHNETYMLGTEWYRQQMPYSAPEQITVEKTPGYITSKLAAKRVLQMNPNMKLLVIVRDPVIRTISDFTQVFYTKLERNKTLSEFENVVFLPNSSQINLRYKPVQNSLYAEHLEHWLHYFPLSQFLIIDGDKFITNPLSQ
uniref:Sulfotransferase domain-containing protein n=1 Tax=Acrobeloides nanus TaxID=290746 RepID=A0A914EGP3_9BILA